MGDAAVRVQTRFETSRALIEVVGTSLMRGSLRLPIQLRFSQPFEVVLVASDGTEAVRGSAEVVEHAGHATWIRFLSAAPESPGDDSARCMLADVDVSTPAENGEPVAPPSTEAFEAITAVKARPAALDEIPAGLAEPVPMIIALPVLPPPPAPTFDTSDTGRRTGALVAQSSEGIVAAEASNEVSRRITVEAAPIVRIVPPATDLTPVPAAAESLAPVVPVAPVVPTPVVSMEPLVPMAPVVAIVTEDAEPIRINETRDTEASPPLVVLDLPIEPQVVVLDLPFQQPLPKPIQQRDTQPTPMPMAAVADIAASTAHERSESTPSTGALATSTGNPTSSPATSTTESPTTSTDSSTTTDSPASSTNNEAPAATHRDKVAHERGIAPIDPNARESLPMGRARRIVIAAASCAMVCLAVTIGVIVWAHGAVARAETKPVTPVKVITVPVAVAARVPAEPVAVAPADPVAPAEQVEPPVTATTCTLDIDATVKDSSVLIDGKDRGLAPTTATVPCGTPVDVQVRHARYETFKQTLTPSSDHEALHAALEREKTTLTVWSEPPAQVTYNGTPIGTTPVTTKVNRFERGTLRFSAPGMQADWRRIQPKSGASSVTVKLARAR